MSGAKITQILALCVFCAVFGACARDSITKSYLQIPQSATQILDFQNLDSQISESKTLDYENLNSQTRQKLTKAQLQKLKDDYLQKFFSPWSEKPNPNKNEVFWITRSLENGAGWGQNTKRLTKDETLEILASMDLPSYPNANLKAIVTKTTSARATPSIAPKFDKQNDYPFDMWQNSLIFYGTPILITHIDTSARWAHIQSAFVSGWVEMSDIALVSKAQEKEIMAWKNYAFVIKDNHAIKSANHFVTQARIGQILAVKSDFDKIANNFEAFENLDSENSKKHAEIYTFLRDEGGNLHISSAKISSDALIYFPQDFDERLSAFLIDQLLGDKYGWGGLYEERDCSAFVRDLAAANGIFLPRNSRAQVRYGGNAVDLKDFKRKDKERQISNSTPFYTILWKQGHIVLYVGQLDNRALIAHSVWGVSNKKKKFVIGGVVITDLHLEMRAKKGLFGRKKMIDTIGAMSDLSVLRAQILEN